MENEDTEINEAEELREEDLLKESNNYYRELDFRDRCGPHYPLRG